jgi:hypothetical protein
MSKVRQQSLCHAPSGAEKHTPIKELRMEFERACECRLEWRLDGPCSLQGAADGVGGYLHGALRSAHSAGVSESRSTRVSPAGDADDRPTSESNDSISGACAR